MRLKPSACKECHRFGFRSIATDSAMTRNSVANSCNFTLSRFIVCNNNSNVNPQLSGNDLLDQHRVVLMKKEHTHYGTNNVEYLPSV